MNNEHKPLTTPWLYLDEILKEEIDFLMEAKLYLEEKWEKHVL